MNNFMKTLAGAGLAAAVLAGTPAMALADGSDTTLTEESLTEMVTLRPSGTQVTDTLGGPIEAASGMPFIFSGYPFNGSAVIAASEPISAADGSLYRAVSLKTACDGRGMYFLPEAAVETSQHSEYPADQLRFGRPSANDGDLRPYAAQFEGVGLLAAQPIIYLTPDLSSGPIARSTQDATETPMTAPFEANGSEWRMALVPGLTHAYVLASETSAFTPWACAPSNIHSATSDAAVYNQMIHAANLATSSKQAAAEPVAGTESGVDPASVAMLVGGVLVAGVAVAFVAAEATSRKRNKKAEAGK